MSIKNVSDPSTVLKEMFDAAVGAANPMVCVPPHLPKAPSGRTIVLGAGKASAMMAKAVEEHWTGNISGCVATRYNYAVSCTRIEIIEASHPVPDAASANAAHHILKLANNLKADDLCIALISGGASSLLSYPSKGLTLKDKTVSFPENLADLTIETVDKFIPSTNRRLIKLIETPKRREVCELLMDTQGKTLSKVLNARGVGSLFLRNLQMVPTENSYSLPHWVILNSKN